jgi:hypothetical protein
LVKEDRGDLFADPHNILNRWKNYFGQLLNIHGEGGVWQTEMHTAEPFVPQPSASEVEFAVGKLKRYKSPGFIQIPAELTQAGGGILCSEIHKHFQLIWKKRIASPMKTANCGTHSKKEIKLTVVIIEAYHFCQLDTKFYQTFFAVGELHMQMKLLGFTNVDFDITDQDRSNFLYPADTGEKLGYKGTVHQLLIEFKKAYVLVRTEALNNILIEFGIPRKLAGRIR